MEEGVHRLEADAVEVGHIAEWKVILIHQMLRQQGREVYTIEPLTLAYYLLTMTQTMLYTQLLIQYHTLPRGPVGKINGEVISIGLIVFTF